MAEQWIWQCDRVIPTDNAAGRGLLDEVLAQLERQHWRQHDVFGVHLAMEEALRNAIQHGNQLDASKRIHVNCRVSPERIRIEIADEGAGFDPAALPDPTCSEGLKSPTGRGVLLMRAFMSRVEYSAAGNRVVLEKERPKHE